jgi:hypothetical protein
MLPSLQAFKTTALYRQRRRLLHLKPLQRLLLPRPLLRHLHPNRRQSHQPTPQSQFFPQLPHQSLETDRLQVPPLSD